MCDGGDDDGGYGDVELAEVNEYDEAYYDDVDDVGIEQC